MNKIKTISLIVAVIVLILALASPKIANQKKSELVEVLVLTTDVKKDSKLEADHVELIKYPKDYVVEGALSDLAAIEGMIADQNLYKHEVITENKIFKPGSAASGLSFLIDKNQRAITIDVGQATGMSGLLKPGSMVDIITVKEGQEAYILLENKKVLAVDRTFRESDNIEMPKEMYVTITLSVSPKEAVKLALAAENGTNRAILRNPTDKSKTGPQRVGSRG